MSESKQINLFVITTGKYKQFFPALLEGVKKFFLVDHKVTIELFTDEVLKYEGDERVRVKETLIVSYRFPQVTLYRYKLFESKARECDFMFYIDVDMAIVDYVGEEILGDLVAARHPGFFHGGGSWETNEKSMCFTEPENRIKYFAGGFNGGSNAVYGRMIHFLKNIIETDEKNDVMPIWHDESALNFFLSFKKPTVELDPSYCMVEEESKRVAWGISNFKPRIIALAKNHSELRS